TSVSRYWSSDVCSSYLFIGYLLPKNGSEHQGGIMRLKFPGEAPSRSTLKLDEAILTFLPESDRERLLRASAKAVDLGAAPGGWRSDARRVGTEFKPGRA